MIIMQLLGGLGNQLFQYATARRLAYKHNVPLKLDISEFEVYKLHRYSLQHFALPQDFAARSEIEAVKTKGLARKLIRLTDKLRMPIRFRHVIERSSRFDPTILNLGSSAYMEGYWQSERYFEDIVPVLRDELRFITVPTPENEKMIEDIDSVEAVSLHVRRGDYVSDSRTFSIHGLTSLDYYNRAIAYIAERVANFHLYVFSDDIDWVQENLILMHPTTYVSHNNAERNYEDLRLMSHCRHHIIANSSFSWWGAWLNPSTDKIVIAPEHWANNTELNTLDRIPRTWLKM